MKNEYQSEILQVIHEDMKGMHQLGIISDVRMQEFDVMCLKPEPEAAPPCAKLDFTAESRKRERYDLVIR